MKNGYIAGGKLLRQMIEFSYKKDAAFMPDENALKEYKRVFEDSDLINTAFTLFDNDLNVSKTAAKLYMHRNTLIYRVTKIKKLTGLNVTNYFDAVAFITLYYGYCSKFPRPQ